MQQRTVKKVIAGDYFFGAPCIQITDDRIQFNIFTSYSHNIIIRKLKLPKYERYNQFYNNNMEKYFIE